MHAIRLHARDIESLRYEEAPTPWPGPGEVLVRVRAAAVTPTELQWVPTWTTRDGGPRPLPIIPGHEFSGEVVAVGDGVVSPGVGEDVYGINDWFGEGSQAEFCVARADQIACKPVSLDHAHTAVIPISALTAWQGLFERGNLVAGQHVLIHGGAGGVGSFAVQFAHRRGARVTATASGNNLEFVRNLGADDVIDYRAERFEDRVRGVDMVFDTVGGDTLQRSWPVLRPGGRLVTVAASEEHSRDDRIRTAFFVVEPRRGELEEIARWIDRNEIRPIVGAAFPLAEALHAYRHKPRHGKVVLWGGQAECR